MQRNDPCWCGSEKKWKKCHYPEGTPLSFEELRREYAKKYQIRIKTAEEIAGIKKACKLSAEILQKLLEACREGVTTNEIDALSLKLHADAGATPAPLGYGSPPFPKSICTSLNEVICHGIPDDVPLKNGDILNIDTSCILNGYYGDCSEMAIIGEISEEKQLVIDVSRECLKRSIAILKPGILVSDIGKVIEDYARSKNCSVVDDFVGHGVGLEFHEPPQVPHHYNNTKIPLVPGMIFTIEPMINAGVRSSVVDKDNQWVARTGDLKPSAQCEHTILITETGHEILTLI
ncbi:MAG: methionyl aminopeptidase [Candidatus Algichlamydia australiensis]|nr:methionyl aminopeptidase [Chlamydiales bacterium]